MPQNSGCCVCRTQSLVCCSLQRFVNACVKGFRRHTHSSFSHWCLELFYNSKLRSDWLVISLLHEWEMCVKFIIYNLKNPQMCCVLSNIHIAEVWTCQHNEDEDLEIDSVKDLSAGVYFSFLVTSALFLRLCPELFVNVWHCLLIQPEHWFSKSTTTQNTYACKGPFTQRMRKNYKVEKL